MNDMREILGTLIGEMKELSPRFENLVEEADAKLATLSKQHLTGESYARTQLPVAIASEASKKLLLLTKNNLFYLETISILGLTRYLFELLVWLRTIERNRLRSVEFFVQTYEEQHKHITRYIQRLETEAAFFDQLSEKDGLPESLLEAMRSNAKELTEESVRDAIVKHMAAVDLEARRRFCLYRRPATTNGYGFQAHLIRSKTIKTAQKQLDQLLASRAEFETRVTSSILKTETRTRKDERKRWNWAAEANLVEMKETYEFIYSYTSRLLHATPTSFYTNMKNLEPREIEMFLDFSHVTLLDLYDAAEKLVRD